MNDDEHIRQLIIQTVHETLASLGVDPRRMNDVQADMLYLRRIRRSSEEMGRRLRQTSLTLLATAMIAALWQGIRHALN